MASKCPELQFLPQLIDAQMTEDQQAGLEHHIESCSECQDAFDKLAESDKTDERIVDRLRERRPESEPALLNAMAIMKSTKWGEATASGAPSEDLALDFLTPSEDPESIGRLGPYEIGEVVGSGGMGIVLKGIDAKLNRVVAVKVLVPTLASNATARKRFLREAQAAAAVGHPHVVTIHAVDEDQLPYLVMEFVSGQSLQEKVNLEGPLELKQTLRIGVQIASGLAAAHAQGLVHRDIKPANILLENGIERVKITDFGLACAVDDVAITRTGEVTGTPQYMSPEQAQGMAVDYRTDLFSLGSVLYAMCTGRSPFRAENTLGVIRRVCDDTPRPIHDINPDAPDWLVEIIDRLLSKNADERHQSAEEVSQLLGDHLAHLQHPDRVPKPTSGSGRSLRSPNRRLLVVAVVLLLITATLGATDATGITHVASTVIRIVIGEGTLVVEIDDPSVNVSIDGDHVNIRGAGVEEVKLRPGSYQFLATKDGQPIKREFVAITRGARRVVTVRFEDIQQEVLRQEATFAYSAIPKESISLSRTFDGHSAAVTDIAITSDGRFILSCQSRPSCALHLWDASTGKLMRRVELPSVTLNSVAISPDNQLVATGSLDSQLRGVIRLWDPQTLGLIRTLDGHSSHIQGLAFSPDGLCLASGSDDKSLRIWDVKTGEQLHRCEPQDRTSGYVFEIQFSPDGQKLLAAHARQGAIVWSVNTGRESRRLEPTNGSITAIAISQDGRLAASASWEGGVSLWDFKTGRPLGQLAGHDDMVRSLRFSTDGRHLITAAQDKTMRIWNIDSAREVSRIECSTHCTNFIDSSPNGQHVVSGGGFRLQNGRPKADGDYALRLWRLPESTWQQPGAKADE